MSISDTISFINNMASLTINYSPAGEANANNYQLSTEYTCQYLQTIIQT